LYIHLYIVYERFNGSIKQRKKLINARSHSRKVEE